MARKECHEIHCLLCFDTHCYNAGVVRLDGKCLSLLTWDDKPILKSTRDFEAKTKGNHVEYTPGDAHYLVGGLVVPKALFYGVLARAQDRLIVQGKI